MTAGRLDHLETLAGGDAASRPLTSPHSLGARSDEESAGELAEAETALQMSERLSGKVFVIEINKVERGDLRSFLITALQPIVTAHLAGMDSTLLKDIVYRIVIQDYEITKYSQEQRVRGEHKSHASYAEQLVGQLLDRYDLGIGISSVTSIGGSALSGPLPQVRSGIRAIMDEATGINLAVTEPPAALAPVQVADDQVAAPVAVPPPVTAVFERRFPPAASLDTLGNSPAFPTDLVVHGQRPLSDVPRETVVTPHTSAPFPALARSPSSTRTRTASQAKAALGATVTSVVPDSLRLPRLPNYDVGVDCTAAVVALAEFFKNNRLDDPRAVELLGEYLAKLRSAVGLRLAIHTGQRLNNRIHLSADEVVDGEETHKVLRTLSSLLQIRLKPNYDMKFVQVTFGPDAPEGFDCPHTSAL